MNVIGSMIVKLSAHIAEFDANLRKAAGRAEQTATQINSAFASQSIAVGSFGIADAVNSTASNLASAAPKIENVSNRIQRAWTPLLRLLGIAGRGAMGRVGYGAMSGVEALAGATGVGLGIGAGALAIGVATAGAVRLGNAIKIDRIEAERLGISYEKVKEAAGEIAIPPAAQRAAEDMATAWNFAWKYAKAIGQTTITLPFIPLTQMARSLRLPLSDEQQEIEARTQALLPKIPTADVGKMMEQWQTAMGKVGKTDLEIFIAQLKEAGASAVSVALATQSWDDAMKRVHESVIGFHEAFVREIDSVDDALWESSEKVAAQAEAWFDNLAAQGKRLAETPIDRFQSNLDALYEALRVGPEGGGITQAQFDAARIKLQTGTAAELMRELKPPGGGGAAAALWSGSKEASDAIANSISGTSVRELDELRRIRGVLDKIEAKPGAIVQGAIP